MFLSGWTLSAACFGRESLQWFLVPSNLTSQLTKSRSKCSTTYCLYSIYLYQFVTLQTIILQNHWSIKKKTCGSILIYPPLNNIIYPREKENHLQNAFVQGDMLVPRRALALPPLQTVFSRQGLGFRLPRLLRDVASMAVEKRPNLLLRPTPSCRGKSYHRMT